MRQQWKRSGKRKDRVKLRKQNRFDGFLSVTLSFFPMYFLQVVFESHLVYDQSQGTGAVFSRLYG
jgi:hypothetical protein